MENPNPQTPEKPQDAPKDTTPPNSPQGQTQDAPKDTTPPNSPETPKAPELDFKGLIEEAVKAALAKQPTTPQDAPPEPPKETTPPETPQEDPVSNVIRDMLIKTNNVPDVLVPLLPKNLKDLSEYLSSEPYKLAVKTLSFTPQEPPKDPPKTQETPAGKEPPTETTPKTFKDIDINVLAQALKGVISDV